MNRRRFLQTTALATLSGPALANWLETHDVPVRALTGLPGQPGYHWFGYYDKLQFDPTGRYVLGMRVAFDGGRPPEPDDVLEIGLIDLQKPAGNWRKLGESRAWGWQQGCMLQWIPGSRQDRSNGSVIWNDRATTGPDAGQYVSHILNIKTGKKRTLPRPIYALSPDGRWAVGTEFNRIQNLRPGYGYAGIPDPYFEQKTPAEIGLYRMDLKTGDSKLLFSIEQAAQLPHQGADVRDNFHWFNHLLINTDGSRILFLNRWRKQRIEPNRMAVGDFTTRMFTINADGTEPFVVDPSGNSSHFVWRDPTHICVYTRPIGRPSGFYVLEDRIGQIEPIQTTKMPENGHQTYVPGKNNQWLLSDNYAKPNGNRDQVPFLYHLPTDRRIDLGRFPAAPLATGEWRCDLHPRTSPDGRYVCIDSTHGGNGRQMYLLDISGVFNS